MKGILVGLSMLVLVLGLYACTKKACERVCNCRAEEAVSGTEQDTEDLWGKTYVKECIKECEKSMDESSAKCRRAYRKYARCVEKNDCQSSMCEAEANEWANEC